MTSAFTPDVLIIGGGIAGLSLAAALGGEAKVLVLEAEDELAFHTSSRSAQQMQPSHGPAPVRALTEYSIELVTGFEAAIGRPILRPRPLLSCEFDGIVAPATPHGGGHFEGFEPLPVAEAYALAPVLRPGIVLSAGIDASSKEVRVTDLIEHYRSTAVAKGVAIVTGARVTDARRDSVGWTVSWARGSASAPIVVDAAGAWADQVAALFGVAAAGLVPFRRTVVVARAAQGPLDSALPMVGDAAGSRYFRETDGDVLASPQEDEPSPPENARPRAEVTAEIVRRIEEITTLTLEPRTSWTGLRTISDDGLPVMGAEPGEPGFWWLAGQGGYGIQTSAGIARTIAGRILGRENDVPGIVNAAMDALSPARFRS